MADRVAIEFINVFGMPPVDFIELAARLDCPKIGLAPRPIVTLPGLFPQWDMLQDAALASATKAALSANGVAVTLAEGFLVLPPEHDIDHRPALDLVAGLGARLVNACCLAPDFAANVEGFGKLCEQAEDRGLIATAEFLPGMVIGSLDSAVALAQQVRRPNAGVLVDAMHLFRSGSTVDDLRAVPSEYIRYAQVCDVPLMSTFENYADEARYHRLPPGAGELPLKEFVAALPDDITIGFEVPMRDRVESGADWESLLSGLIQQTRTLF